MSVEHTALDVGKLSPAAQKALGPGPGRMMASRGLVPLPPAEQAAVLYQLALDSDATIATSAMVTAGGLPEKVLAAALADAALDPRVLDFYSERVAGKPAAFEALAHNTATADDTIARLAGLGSARDVDLIAANEQRLLRHPQIIAAMYMNRQARMSTVDRAVELAVRNQVRVPGLAAWDEIARALDSAPPATAENDALYAAAVEASTDDTALTVGDAEQVIEDTAVAAVQEKADGRKVPIERMSAKDKIRLALTGNGFDRSTLVRDPLKVVALAAIKSPAVTEFEAAHYAGNASLTDEVIRFIAGKREWTKLYGTKVALCRNPKTPVSDSMRLMPFLRDKDLVNMTKSKGIPSAVVAQARKLLMQRRGGEKK